MTPTSNSTAALEMARRALAHLEEQAAGFGALHIPAHLRIELEDKRCEVAELEARLGLAGAPSPTVAVFDQRGQQVGTQTNVAGDYHAAPNITIIGDGNVIGNGNTVRVDKTAGAGSLPAAETTPLLELASLRARLQRLDAVEIESLCLDHFPAVYDKFARGLQRGEMLNLLLDHCRRNPAEAVRLAALLRRTT